MRNNRFIYLFWLFLTSFLMISLVYTAILASETAVPSPTIPITTGIQQIKSDVTGLQFNLNTAQWEMDSQNTIQIAGLTTRVQEPGAPALPYFATYIVLPPEATAAINVQGIKVTTSQANSVLAVPSPVNESENKSRLDQETTRPTYLANTPNLLLPLPNPAIYQNNAFYPETLYALSEPMYYRDLRLVELRLYPVRYNPVTHSLQQVQQMAVSLQFQGANLTDLHPAPTPDDPDLLAFSELILNFDQLSEWRSLPAELINFPGTSFPVGAAETYKIEVNQDGIYEISGAELAAQGMAIANIDPTTLEMMHRGQAVAFQFVDEDDIGVFNTDDKIRFYGWAFDGPRTDKQFITNNVFWLWAGGTATTIGVVANQTEGAIVNSVMTAVTREPEKHFTSTYSDQWHTFPNEPDGWYWDYLPGTTTPVTHSYTITLPYPAATGPAALITAEMMPFDSSFFTNPADYTYTITPSVNDNSGSTPTSWIGRKNVNVTGTVPLNELNHLVNDVHLKFSASNDDASVFLNRITIEYLRQLVALGDQIIFNDETGGIREFQISGFSVEKVDDILVWNITNRHTPSQIDMNSHINGSSSYTYDVGVGANETDFIATTITNTIKPAAISQYVPQSLVPTDGQADWIAISHSDFITEANRLAEHRHNFSGLQTWVVDVEDVTNQYGYGLPLPAAIHDYLAYALSNWSTSYAVLLGSATVNPRNLDCPYITTCLGNKSAVVWDKDQPTFVVTDLVYEDRFQGLIPSDHTIVLLSGGDLIPDMAIGRITVETETEAATVVSKIILYEQTQMTAAAWQQSVLFVADDDLYDIFYNENILTANILPSSYSPIQRYLITNTITATNNLRIDMLNHVNGQGVSILNYRGHGKVDGWATPYIISTEAANLDFWKNDLKPTVILSADCLDGNFAIPGLPALSQELLTLQSGSDPVPVGTAAHWSATGLGYTSEHSVLHQGFYNGLFTENMLTIGDAINHAKIVYAVGGHHDSELYSFLLQGDPAMQMFTMRNHTYLPAITNPPGG